MGLLLAIDVGNTNIVIGAFGLDGGQKPQLRRSWRMATARERTADEYGLMIQYMLGHQGMELAMVKDVVIGSVVPPLQPVFEACCHRYFDAAPLWVGHGIHTGLGLAIENPSEIGADRIANCVGALEQHGAPAIAVDLGTATTFDVVNERQEYIGGMILPGVKIAAEALFQRAAKLPRVEIVKPDKLIGRNTVQAMQSGLFYGCVGQIDGILERLSQQLPNAAIVATGGLAKTIGKESKFIQRVEPDLTLNGLRSLWLLNRQPN